MGAPMVTRRLQVPEKDAHSGKRKGNDGVERLKHSTLPGHIRQIRTNSRRQMRRTRRRRRAYGEMTSRMREVAA